MSTDYGYGREEIVFAVAEGAFGVHTLPLATSAMKVISTDFKMTQERKDRKEKGSTRSIVDRFSGKKSAEWNITKYILPSGTAGTAPDDDALFEAAMGTGSNDPGVSEIYSLAAEPAITLDLVREVGPFREAVQGAVPDNMEISFGGGEEPKVTFSGPGKDLLTCGRDSLSAGVDASTTIKIFKPYQFEVGMYVKIGTDDNGGAGFLITAIDVGLLELTVADVATAPNGFVIPMPVTATTAGDVIPVIVGSVDLGTGGSHPVTSGRVTLNNNLAMRNDEFGSDAPTGARYPAFREVTFSLDIYLLAGDIDIINSAKKFVQNDVAIILGGTAGKILTIDMNQCEFEIPAITIPEEGETTISISGKALGSAGEDELTVTFT